MQAWMTASERAGAGKRASSMTDLLMGAKGMVPGGFIDHLVHSVEAGVQDAGAGSVIFSSRPISNAIHKLAFQVMLVLNGIVLTLTFFLAQHPPLVELMEGSQFAVSHARVSVLETRSPHANASLAHVSFLNCSSKFTPSLRASNGSHFFFSFPRPIVADGWEFYTSSADTSFQQDPISLELHVSKDSHLLDPMDLNESSWELKSKFDCRLSSATALCESDVANVTMTRNVRYHFDLRMSWQYIFELISMGLKLFGNVGTPMLAAAGFIYLGRTALASAFHVVGVLDIIVAIFTPLSLFEFFQCFFGGVIQLMYGLVLQTKEGHTIKFLPVFIFARSFTNTLMINLREAKFSVTSNSLRLDVMSLIFLWITLLLSRRRLLHQSFKQIEQDISAYDELWRQVARDKSNLVELNEAVAKIRTKSPAEQQLALTSAEMMRLRTCVGLGSIFSTQQAHRPQPCLASKGITLASALDAAKHLSLTSPHLKVTSLEQLYVQAFLLEPIFFAKIKHISVRCRCFLLSDGSAKGCTRYISLKEVADEPDRACMIRRPSIKSVTRAIQKAVRSYGGDVSRLLDIVRYALVFEDLEELKQAVEVILEDPHIHIVRVKNRFDESYPSNESGGYRDICLNIRISTQYTRKFFIDRHLCELQLVLKSFMELRNENGHKNYRIFRDLRCE
eukprot:747212-Hanusia_phi.AAC.1